MVEHHLFPHRAGHARQRRHPDAELPGRRGEIALPAHPGQRVALAKQEAVAELPVVGGGGAFVEQRQGQLAAAVRHFQQQRAVAARRVGGAQDGDVRHRLDPPFGVARREREVGDDRVARVGRVHGMVARPEMRS